jgi:hypothetical protein
MATQGKTTRVQHNAPIIVEQIQMSDGNNNHVVMMGQMQDGAFVAVKQADQEKVVYAGISKGAAVINRMIGVDYSEMQELLTRAVNNRTRQRNFFRLQNSMLEGLITEEEFYKTLEENEDDYVVEELESPSHDRIEHALNLTQGIKDVNNSEDFANLFSFSTAVADQELQKIEENGGL